ncbi:hypothetical protein CDL15_Pgr009114 [Punica granatum]|uniref:Uncharacterized protein n=1 Tax=Punica granatum TaxID=22663 RepID=A0A218Y124_PUNGR|nr:hypothetical protein CDL15_Pgr009114 [Punica granatum]
MGWIGRTGPNWEEGTGLLRDWAKTGRVGIDWAELSAGPKWAKIRAGLGRIGLGSELAELGCWNTGLGRRIPYGPIRNLCRFEKNGNRSG